MTELQCPRTWRDPLALSTSRPLQIAILCLVLLAASVAEAGPLRKPIVCRSNTIYDGQGAVIDARNLSRVFNVWGVRNVTIRNYTIIGGRKTRMFDISSSRAIKVENITVQTGAADVVHVHNSSNININRVVADVVDRYLVWVDTSSAVRIARCALLTGSKFESGIRVMDWTSNVIIEGCTIRARLNKQTALRLHDGENFHVRWSQFEGHVWAGPMGGDDGGQKLANAKQRRTYLAKRTHNVLFEDVDIHGSLGPQAGLSGFAMLRGSIVAKPESPFFNSPFNNTTWSYPERRYAQASDPVRPAATGLMRGVRFVAPRTHKLNYRDNGPFELTYCTLNGKAFRG